MMGTCTRRRWVATRRTDLVSDASTRRYVQHRMDSLFHRARAPPATRPVDRTGRRLPGAHGGHSFAAGPSGPAAHRLSDRRPVRPDPSGSPGTQGKLRSYPSIDSPGRVGPAPRVAPTAIKARASRKFTRGETHADIEDGTRDGCVPPRRGRGRGPGHGLGDVIAAARSRCRRSALACAPGVASTVVVRAITAHRPEDCRAPCVIRVIPCTELRVDEIERTVHRTATLCTPWPAFACGAFAVTEETEGAGGEWGTVHGEPVAVAAGTAKRAQALCCGLRVRFGAWHARLSFDATGTHGKMTPDPSIGPPVGAGPARRVEPAVTGARVATACATRT